jgi:hypothetical protein
MKIVQHFFIYLTSEINSNIHIIFMFKLLPQIHLQVAYSIFDTSYKHGWLFNKCIMIRNQWWCHMVTNEWTIWRWRWRHSLNLWKKTWPNQNAINDINALVVMQHFDTNYIFWTHITCIRLYVNKINML